MNFQTMTRQFFGTPGADKKSYITICLEQTAAEITADRSGSYYQRAHLSNSSSLKIIATAGCPTFRFSKVGFYGRTQSSVFLNGRDTFRSFLLPEENP